MISYGFSYHIAVFLFNEAIIVFAVGTATGELDVILDAPIKDLMVNELAAVITINAEREEREVFFGIGDLLLDPAMGVIQQAASLSLGRTGIG